MNTAVGIQAQGIAISGIRARHVTLATPLFTLFVLISLVLFSALSVIYTSDLNRREFGNLTQLQKSRDALYTRWGQLLLEENTWSAPERLEAVAEQNLAMVIPTAKNVVIVNS